MKLTFITSLLGETSPAVILREEAQKAGPWFCDARQVEEKSLVAKLQAAGMKVTMPIAGVIMPAYSIRNIIVGAAGLLGRDIASGGSPGP